MYSDLTWSRIAALTPIVFEAANLNDQVANNIIEHASNQLCSLIYSVYRKLEFKYEEKVPIVFSGGNLTFDSSPLLLKMKKKISDLIPRAEITLPLMEPSVSAAILALNTSK